MARAGKFARPFRVEDGRKFRLADVEPGDTGALKSKEEAKEWLDTGAALLSEMQEKLYAQDQWAVLLILQGMDAAGKDSVIKHVMSGINPQGCQVSSFKTPSAEELNHDFLWRAARNLPLADRQRSARALLARVSAKRRTCLERKRSFRSTTTGRSAPGRSEAHAPGARFSPAPGRSPPRARGAVRPCLCGR